MKKLIAIITTLSITLSLFIFPVSAKAATAVDITISVDEIRQIRVTPKEGFATKWRTSDRNIVMVSKTGKIKGIAEGKATVTATAGKSTLKFNIIVKKAEEPVLLPDAPEIVFLLLTYGAVKTNDISGLFIDNKGNIKEFSFKCENMLMYVSDEKFPDNIAIFDINIAMHNFEKIIENANSTKRKVELKEIERYYTTLKKIDENSRISFYDDVAYQKEGDFLFMFTDDEWGNANYYGIKKTLCGELEVILLKGRGDSKLDNTSQNAEKIYEWLIETIPFKMYRKGSTNGMYHEGYFEVDYDSWYKPNLNPTGSL